MCTPKLLFRLQIRALLKENYHELQIALTLGCCLKTVYNWKNRFKAGDSILDRARSGRPMIITISSQLRLIAFYCQHKPLLGCCRWSIRDAEWYLKKHPEILQVTISRSSIQRYLVFHGFKPHRWKYFLHISDPDFFEKMEKIIMIYLNPPKYLYCFDECTGLQALEMVSPSLPADRNAPKLKEFKYERHGTVSILSILNVADGKVFTEPIADHTAATIIEFLKKHILQHDPIEELHYICDNYSSHSTDGFCREIAKICDVKYPDLKTVEERRMWLQNTDKRIVFHFLPFHGSWLNQIEIWFGILQRKALRGESFSSTKALKNAIVSFNDTWNTDFSHPFKWGYTGEDLYEKVVHRLIKWLHLESQDLDYKFLGKQLALMNNLIVKYWGKVNKDVWVSLYKTLKEKESFVCGIIRNINPENYKGSKNCSNEQLNKKIEEIKRKLTLSLLELKRILSLDIAQLA